MIPESEPYQISIHHLAFVETDEHVGIWDRGSRYGTLVDGQQLGGTKGDPKPFILSNPETILVLGTIHSCYKYRVLLCLSKVGGRWCIIPKNTHEIMNLRVSAKIRTCVNSMS